MKMIVKITFFVIFVSSVILLLIGINYNYVNLPYNRQVNYLRQIEFTFLEKTGYDLIERTSVYYGKNEYYITIANDGEQEMVFVHDVNGKIIKSAEYNENNILELEKIYNDAIVEYGYDNKKIILRVKIVNDEQLEFWYYNYDNLEQYQKYIFK